MVKYQTVKWKNELDKGKALLSNGKSNENKNG